MVRDLGIIECIGDGWDRYKVNLGIATGGLLLYFLIVAIGSFIPIIKFVFGFVIAPALAGGLYLFFLNVAQNQNPRIEDLFDGFHRFMPLLGLQWLATLVGVAVMIPGIIALFFIIGGSKMTIAVGICIIGINLFFLIWLITRYSMVYFILMEDRQILLFDALRKSADLTRGNAHNLFLLGLVSGIICAAATLCLIVPVIFAAPALHTAYAMAYLKLKEYAAESGAGVIAMDQPTNPVVG